MQPAGLVLGSGVEDAIRHHARAAYPHECCGALIGRGDTVLGTHPLPNRTEEGPRRRFLVRPEDYRDAERESQARGEDLLGFYHSHPDHPARPSQYDLDHAWPSFSYVIVSSTTEGTGALTSWRLRDDRTAFDEQPLTSAAHDISRAADRAASVAGDR